MKSDGGEVCGRQEMPPCVEVETRRLPKSIFFDTRDHGLGDSVLHPKVVVT